MKIKLKFDLPVGSDHGMKAGRVLEVVREQEEKGRGLPRWYVMGDTGEEVGVLLNEAGLANGD